jgi:hypothetical protein
MQVHEADYRIVKPGYLCHKHSPQLITENFRNSTRTAQSSKTFSNAGRMASFNVMSAVKSQIWIALCIYLLVAITKKRLKIDASAKDSSAVN